MRTLVINLTRFGDLLQTQPVLSGFKASGHEVGLVCLENFAGATVLLRDVDRVFPLPGARLLSGLQKDWRLGVGDFWSWAESGLGVFQPDMVVNLTSSVPARLLARLLGSSRQRGFCIDEFGFGTHSNPWAAFLMASARHRGSSPFNLVDLFIRAAELVPAQRDLALKPPAEESRDNALETLKRGAPVTAKGFVGMQLGASSDIRRWPVRFFADLAEQLWDKYKLCAVLLGSSGEAVLGERFESQSQAPCVNIIGKTNFVELAAMLANVRLLITNDTGTMHLAAGLGVPVAAIFLATAQPWDTGPYRNGCLCLEPDTDCHPCGFSQNCPFDNACRAMITPQSVMVWLEPWLQGRGWPRRKAQGVRAWVTKTDQNAFMDMESLSGHEQAPRTGWIRMQRMAYRHFLDQAPPQSGSWSGPGLPAEFSSGLMREFEDSGKILFLMQEQVRLLRHAPSPQVRRKFLSNWQRLTSRWTENPRISVLGDLWREESQVVAEDVHALELLVSRYSGLVSQFSAFLRDRGTNIE